MRQLLAHLLYEMVHAFLGIYACLVCARRRVSRNACTLNVAKITGLSGHGPDYRRVALALQQVDTRMLSGLTNEAWDLGIDRSFELGKGYLGATSERADFARLVGLRKLYLVLSYRKLRLLGLGIAKICIPQVFAPHPQRTSVPRSTHGPFTKIH